MKGVMDYAKYFMKNATGLDNTYDGNMKLQKLLTFSNLINIALNDEPLFKEKMKAFKDGCVVEPVCLKYKKFYQSFKKDSQNFIYDFSNSEMEVLNLTLNIFDNLTARELSDLNHEFDFWKKSYGKYEVTKNGNDSYISDSDIKKEIHIMTSIIDSYKNRNNDMSIEKVNDIEFYYDSSNLDINGTTIVDGKEVKILDELYDFSLSEEAEDKCYTIYLDECGELVIF